VEEYVPVNSLTTLETGNKKDWGAGKIWLWLPAQAPNAEELQLGAQHQGVEQRAKKRASSKAELKKEAYVKIQKWTYGADIFFACRQGLYLDVKKISAPYVHS